MDIARQYLIEVQTLHPRMVYQVALQEIHGWMKNRVHSRDRKQPPMPQSRHETLAPSACVAPAEAACLYCTLFGSSVSCPVPREQRSTSEEGIEWLRGFWYFEVYCRLGCTDLIACCRRRRDLSLLQTAVRCDHAVCRRSSARVVARDKVFDFRF